MNRRSSVIFVRDIISVSKPVQNVFNFLHFCWNTVLKFWKILYFLVYAVRSAKFSDFKNNLRIWTWYVSIRVGLKRKCKEDLLLWINILLKDSAFVCKNFTSDWCDGVALCALAEAVLPGTFPRYDLLNPSNAEENLRLGLHVIESLTNFNSLLAPSEISSCSPEIENKLIMLFLMLKITLTQSKLNGANSKFHDTLPKLVTQKGFIAKGMGLMQAVSGRKACFNIYFKSCSDLNIVIEIKGPRNSTCSKLITNKSPRALKKTDAKIKKINSMPKQIMLEYELLVKKLCISFVPVYAGKHQLSIVWQGRHMMGSPYFIHVDEFINQDNSQSPGPKKLQKLLSLHKMASFDIPDEDFDEWYVKESCKVQETGVVRKRKLVRQIVMLNGEEINVGENSQDIKSDSVQHSVDDCNPLEFSNVTCEPKSDLNENNSEQVDSKVDVAESSSTKGYKEVNCDQSPVSLKDDVNRYSCESVIVRKQDENLNKMHETKSHNFSKQGCSDVDILDLHASSILSKSNDNLVETTNSELQSNTTEETYVLNHNEKSETAPFESFNQNQNQNFSKQGCSDVDILDLHASSILSKSNDNLVETTNSELQSNTTEETYVLNHNEKSETMPFESFNQNQNFLDNEFKNCDDSHQQNTYDLSNEETKTLEMDNNANAVECWEEHLSNSKSILIDKDMLIVQYSSCLPQEDEIEMCDDAKDNLDINQFSENKCNESLSHIDGIGNRNLSDMIEEKIVTGDGSSQDDTVDYDENQFFFINGGGRKRKSLQWSEMVSSQNETTTSTDSTCVFVDSFSCDTEMDSVSNCERDVFDSCISESHTYHDDFVKRQGFWENVSSRSSGNKCNRDNGKEKKNSLVQEKKEFWEKRMK